MTPGDALAALRRAYVTGTAHPLATLRAWARLAGVNGTARVCLATGDAVVTGINERKGAR